MEYVFVLNGHLELGPPPTPSHPKLGQTQVQSIGVIRITLMYFFSTSFWVFLYFIVLCEAPYCFFSPCNV